MGRVVREGSICSRMHEVDACFGDELPLACLAGSGGSSRVPSAVHLLLLSCSMCCIAPRVEVVAVPAVPAIDAAVCGSAAEQLQSTS